MNIKYTHYYFSLKNMKKYNTILDMIQKTFSLKLPIVITKQRKQFIAYSPVLDISTSGATKKNVQERFKELVTLFIEEITEAGTADEVLSELGWKKIKKNWNPPKVISSQLIGIRLPSIA
jgi:vesicle coat complex subunit